ncbi:E3 ubiquitin-protein ligase TRIM7-like [Hemicordylus capensis]|uniref:E3 ubiquitin-protein ligase TRIM7-like n=1 Tax=Hemicordylus capensis TaxID=884348 RepID=UPI0023034B07|nr:E3 ubiquitin-protein ligase TRIM7-like [Hemicordylus capensis]
MASTSSSDVEQEVICPICLEWLNEPVTLDCGHNFCRSCNSSYCEKWERKGALECPVCKAQIEKGNVRPNWQLANILERIKLLPLCSPESDTCSKHKEKLNLFCKEDIHLVCVRCERSPEHKSHTMLLPEEAAQECKDKLCRNLNVLRKEREDILAFKADTGKEYRYLFRQTEKEKQKTVAEFRQLRQFLDVQEKLLLSQMDEVEKDIVKKRDEYMISVSKELCCLESLIRETEDKCQQPTMRLLQDVKSTLRRYQQKEKFENPVAFPPELKLRIWEFCDINPFLEGIITEFKDNLASQDHHLPKGAMAAPRSRKMERGKRSSACGDSAMAAPRLRKKFKHEATCSVCLEFFRDPVILVCGHNFCRDCIAQCWQNSSAEAAACPQCRESFQPSDFRPNRQLANFVAITQELSGQVRREAGAGRGCERHQKPLKLFCKDDQAPICVVCDRSKEHRAHDVVPVEEAAQEYKDQIYSFLEMLRKEREKILSYKADTEKESQNLLTLIEAEKQKSVAEFRQLHQFLEEQEKVLLAQMEVVEEEIGKKRDEHMAKLSVELYSLENIMQEIEEKCQQSASELLQELRGMALSRQERPSAPCARRAGLRVPQVTVKAFCGGYYMGIEPNAVNDAEPPKNQKWQNVKGTLQRCKERKMFKNSTAFPPVLKWRIWDFCDINPFLEGVMKQFKDTLLSGFQLQKANITLDPDTAYPALILSGNKKSVRGGNKDQDLPDNPERFDEWEFVLGCEGFTAGRHCWEVSVGSEEAWSLGVARKSMKRKGDLECSPEEGIWDIGKWSGEYRANIPDNVLTLSLSEEPKKIRVSLNCAGGRLSFFDADSATLLYTFSEASFPGETLLPFFYVSGEGRLTLSP